MTRPWRRAGYSSWQLSVNVPREARVVHGGVFINYRGDDSYSCGALLYAELSRHFGADLVFLDSESIPAGADYVEQLLGRVRQAAFVLAVIGTRWLTAEGRGGGRSLDDPADWIRRELVEAFAAGVRVVPVLVDGARMPTEAELPGDLEQLARCQYRWLRRRDASADMARLVSGLAGMDADLAAALRRGPYGPPEVACPYPGMQAFGPEDAEFFHGRDALIAALLARLGMQIRRGGGPLVVIGPSGVGKSSLLCAGLLPALARGDLPIDGSAGWPRLYLRPGPDPLAELAAHVAALGIRAEGMPAAMRANPTALRDALRQALDSDTTDTATAEPAVADPASPSSAAAGSARTIALVEGAALPAPGRRGKRVVVVVDQVEELFTLGSTEADRLAMLRVLICASRSCDTGPAPAVVLLGLRADFYAHCARIPELVPHLQDSQVLIAPMTAAEQRQAIVAPAQQVGLQVEPALADLLVAESSGEALPQLAHVLRRTFANRTGRTLTAEGYRATGGIARAVATTADAIHDSLDAADQQLLRRMVVSLVAIVDGAEDTRRRVPRDQLLHGTADQQRDAARILDQLIDQRLVTAEDNTYMLSHEALIRAWPRLQQWLTEDRDGLRLHRELAHRAHAWDRHGRDPAALYAGTELELTRRWATTHHPDDLHQVERDFYHASLTAEQQRRQRTRRRQLRTISGLLVIIVALGLLAWQQRGQAIRQREQAAQQRHEARVALARQLAAQSLSMIDANPDLASLLAVQAYRLDRGADELQAVSVAGLLPLERRLTGHTGWVTAVAFNPDGTTLATASNDGTARLWDAHTGKPAATLTGHTDRVTAVAFSPDGTTLATASWDKTARLWNAIPPLAKQIRKICDAVGRNLTAGEWSQYLPGQQYSRTCQG